MVAANCSAMSLAPKTASAPAARWAWGRCRGTLRWRSRRRWKSNSATTFKMMQLSRTIFLLGIISITFGIARYQTIHQLTDKNLQSMDEYSRALGQVGATNSATNVTSQGNSSFPPDVWRLRRRIALAGGLYGGIYELIGLSAMGLILISVSHYLGRKKRENN